MKHFDYDLKSYAQQGLRSAAEWKSLGRDIAANASPRANLPNRMGEILLFSRDQTITLAPAPRRTRGVAAAAPVKS